MVTSNNSSSTNQRYKRRIFEVIIAVVIIGLAALLCINLKKIVIRHILKTIELRKG